MQDRIRLTIVEGIADVRFNNPAKMNAVDPDMFRAIADVGAQLKGDKSLRVVVLSGEGRAFCAGLDVERFGASTGGANLLPFENLAHPTHGIANFVQHIVWLWRELPVPVIAAVHGIAFGGGFQLALGADIRYLAPGTRLSVMETNWGLVPDMAGTQLMRHLAREDVVRELTYTARIFAADEALAHGFATRITEEPHAAAIATGRDIAMRSPDAIRAVKRLLNQAVACDPGAGLAAERAEQGRLLGGPNQLEAMRAKFEKRPPSFVVPAL
jgi:enoyl-CoA hydratase/carnithine racemase